MPVELRKRKAPAPVPERPAKKPSKVAKAVSKVKEVVTGKPDTSGASNGTKKTTKAPLVGETISLEDFGGEVETNDGKKTTLRALVEESTSGVVLFTYPKASTPGCTNQACLFRDSYDPLTAGGLAIYGLSTDSPKANTTFKTKQKLPYSLLCDPNAALIEAIGLKKAPKGTTRGVFAVDKAGKVLISEAGGPAGTVDAVKKLVGEGGASKTKEEPVGDKIAVAAETKPTEESKPVEEIKSAEETKPTNGDTITEKKPEEAVQEPAD
ncbi:thioredoxin-like protein [Xylariales sp. AK1849]|nr:thioredoxin-like protein [Xylariales sp. AK1849]